VQGFAIAAVISLALMAVAAASVVVIGRRHRGRSREGGLVVPSAE
jgi:hypothetical protein